MGIFGRLWEHDASVHYRRGMHAFNDTAWDRSLQEFQLVLDLTHGDSDPLRNLARFYAAEAALHLGRRALERGEPDIALDHLERAHAWNPRIPELQFLRALAWAQRGQPARALEAVEAARGLDASYAGLSLLRATLLYQHGDAAGAHRELRDGAAGASPTTALGPRLLAVLERVLARWEPARTQLHAGADIAESGPA